MSALRRPSTFVVSWVLALALVGCVPQERTPVPASQVREAISAELIVNPLLAAGADPWIVRDATGIFHYCYSRDNGLRLKSVTRLSQLAAAPERTLWLPPAGTSYSKELWAPELHFLDGKWYVYFAADDGDNQHHRMYALASATAEIGSAFTFVGQVTDATDKWAIDGTVVDLRGRRYFVWSGWAGDVNEAQHLYIAAMDGPARVSSARTLIASPEYDWEQGGAGGGLPTINEGPQLLTHAGRVFIVYSASGSWSDHYCLGLLELTGTDPLARSSWTKSPTPVFEGTDCVVSPGHCSFLRVADQDYIVYHHIKTKGGGWQDRQVKIQPFYWRDGRPLFGVPVQDSAVVRVGY